ncbi:MAG: Calx-beta domain-containing protein, partial [Micrococcales bacterium]
NIRSVTITQNSSTNQFELQGNDIPVTITVNFVDGSRISVAGAVNWRETASGGVLRGIGLRLDQAIADGYPLTAGKSKTYLLKIPNSTLTIANGGSASGNAALSNVLSSLNAQLATVSNFTMSKTAPASVNQGASIAYTIGLGNSGGGVSGTSATVQDVMPAGMTYVSASTGTGVSAVSCSQSGQTLTCTATLSSGLAAYSANGAASFRINAIAPSSGSSITNYASVDPNGTASPPSAAGCSSAMCGNATTTLTGTGVVSGHFTRNGGGAISGATVYLLNSSGTQIATTTTNASGAYSFTALTSGSYGVRFPSNGSIKGKAKTASGNASGDQISGITVNVGSTITDADAVQIDPAGVVYDSVTRQPVSGAVVKFLFNGSVVNNSWLDQTLGGPNTQTTGADGSYSFVLNSTAQSGTYTISVTAPGGYTFQSAAISPSAGPYNPGLGGGIVAIQPQSTAPTGSDSTTYYLDFAFTIGANSATTSNGVINNHIPIDPTPVVTLANTTNAAEPGTNGTMTVSLSTASATSTTISYSVAGTATAGTDYTALSGSVTIAAGQTSATISIPVIDDAVMEGNETVIVTLTGVTSGTASLSTTSTAITATNTIADDDAAVVTLANTTNAAEPGTNGTMTVSLSAASATSTTISYSVAGTATAGTDYTALSGSVTIA